MSTITRGRSGVGRTHPWRAARISLAAVIAISLAGCQAGTAGQSSGSRTLAATRSAVPTASAVSPRATSSAELSDAISRPTEIPSDGTCDRNRTCLGVLKAGTHRTSVFSPAFTFTLPAGGWVNREDAFGVFPLESLTVPGDAIFFFRFPSASAPGGGQAPRVGNSVGDLTDWLGTLKVLGATKPTAVTIGGLSGQQLDVAIAKGTETHPDGCTVRVCVDLFSAVDPRAHQTWKWDLGLAGPERERLILLIARDGVVLIVLDSLDGTTFDSLVEAAKPILASVRFQ